MNPGTHFATPEDAESAFYETLAKGDTDALMLLWSEEDETLCVHPTGLQIRGLKSIRESWRNILGKTKLRVQAETVARWQGTLLSVHHLVETFFVGDDPAPHGPFHVTHVFARGAHGWRLVSRHASTADAMPTASDPEAPPRILH